MSNTSSKFITLEYFVVKHSAVMQILTCHVPLGVGGLGWKDPYIVDLLYYATLLRKKNAFS